MKPKTIICPRCNGDGKIPFIHHDVEVWQICFECFGEGTIPDPDEFVNTLNDLVTAKERTYDE